MDSITEVLEARDVEEQGRVDEQVQLCAWKHGESAACGKKPIIEKDAPSQMLAAQFAAFPYLLPKAKQQAGLLAQSFRCTDEKVGSSKSLSKLCKREVPMALRQGMVTRFKAWMVCIYTFHLHMCASISTGSGLHLSNKAGSLPVGQCQTCHGRTRSSMYLISISRLAYRTLMPRGGFRSQSRRAKVQNRKTLSQRPPHYYRCRYRSFHFALCSVLRLSLPKSCIISTYIGSFDNTESAGVSPSIALILTS
jgi:hypothetical protein